ncbi:oxidoreductase [Actinomadura geliboluensis]
MDRGPAVGGGAAEGAAVSAQIGHAGPVANGTSNGLPSLGPSRSFNPQALRMTRAASRADIERVTKAHADAALLAIEAGFDAVEIHFGHNYLASSFLSPKINKRIRSYPYQEAYLLDSARQFRAALKMPLVLLGGVTRRETMDLAMAGGFQFAAMARALLREPDLLNRMRDEPETRSLCIHCNKCMPTIFSGAHCVLA